MSLSLYTPKGKAEADSLTNDKVVLPGEDRATLESDLSAPGSPSRGSSYRETIANYFRIHGQAAIKTIAQATGIKADAVNLTLHNGKGKDFRHFRAERIWGLNESF